MNFCRRIRSLFSFPLLKWSGISALFIPVLVLFAACQKDVAREPFNILLVSIDTCRADYLSCYGYPDKTTPHLDALAGESVLFEQVIAPVPLTLPSHCSMLTGTIPPYHGVRDNQDYRLDESLTTLAESLQSQGYQTGAVIGSFILDAKFGLSQGFQFYEDQIQTENKEEAVLIERPASKVSSLGISWLEEHKDQPFFLFLHYYDPHFDYNPPEPFATQFKDDLYAGEVAYTDDCIGRVVDQLKEWGIYENTLIVVTSDHGESLGEHGEEAHGFFIYQCSQKVPLIVKMPGQNQASRIQSTVALIDIAPTLLKAAGQEQLPEMQGKPLPGLFAGAPEEELSPIYCESMVPTKYDCNPLLGLVLGDWKYIATTRPELYHLTSDPDEKNNLVDQESEKASNLKDILQWILEREQRESSPGADTLSSPDSERGRQMAALGYLSSSISETTEISPDKCDPKDTIELHENLQSAIVLLSQKNYSAAAGICQKVLEQKPHLLDALLLMYDIYTRQNKLALALIHSRKAVQSHPDSSLAQLALAKTLRLRGVYQEASVHYKRGIELNPNEVNAYNELGLCLAQQGQVEQAMEHFSKALSIQPDHVTARLNLAKAYSLKENLGEAVSHYRKAIELEPEKASAHSALANVLLKQGKAESAVEQYQEALRIRPNWPQVANQLAWVLSTHPEDQARNAQEAIRLAEVLCRQTGYRDPVPLDTLAAAYAEAGRFQKAAATAEKALELARAMGQTNKALEIEKRLKLYQSGQPFRTD